MGTYQHQDRYYKKAKAQGLPSRASFKIEEILKKYPLVKRGDTVLDLGAAPGGWMVMLAKVVGERGRVLGIDLEGLTIKPTPNMDFLKANLSSEQAEAWLQNKLQGKKADGVCSDMSPKLTGIGFKDAFESYQLGMLAFQIAERWLKEKGNLVVKIFPGQELEGYLKTLRKSFDKVKTFEPESSRKTSKEIYVLGMGFKTSKPSGSP